MEKKEEPKVVSTQELIADANRLKKAVQSVLDDCKSGLLKGQLGCGQMFPVDGSPCCTVGLVCKRAGSIPFLLNTSYIAVEQINDSTNKEERHKAVQKPLQDWIASIDLYIKNISKPPKQTTQDYRFIDGQWLDDNGNYVAGIGVNL